ncbi:MAG: hypothetical protein WCK59_02510 [Candidatus Falkowbacteria bacterium]
MNLLKDLSKIYANLNEAVSMCYLVGSNEMFVENMIVGQSLYLGRTLFDSCYQAKDAGISLIDAQKELIVSNQEALVIMLGDLYFAPTISDGIMFGKDLALLRKSYWAIKGINYRIEKV